MRKLDRYLICCMAFGRKICEYVRVTGKEENGMRKKLPTLVTAAISTAFLAQAGMAATSVSAAYPESIVEAIQEMGYKAELTTDSYGDPMIHSAAAGVNFVINFYNCEANADCSDLHFVVIFDLLNGIENYSINSWNGERLMGMSYTDEEGDPVLQHYVASVDGMSRSNFVATFTQWTESLSDFTDYIDW